MDIHRKDEIHMMAQSLGYIPAPDQCIQLLGIERVFLSTKIPNRLIGIPGGTGMRRAVCVHQQKAGSTLWEQVMTEGTAHRF